MKSGELTDSIIPVANEDHYKNRSRVLQISLSFFLLFVAFNTTQNIASVVLEEEGLGSFGFYTLATLYGSLSISALLSSALMKKIGLYRCLVIGSLFHFTFVLANSIPAIRNDYPQY